MKQQLLAWLNERINHYSDLKNMCLKIKAFDIADRHIATISELQSVIDYVNNLEETNVLPEVLKKLHDESYYCDTRGCSIVEWDDVESVFSEYGVKR